jgi:hypothetical protein
MEQAQEFVIGGYSVGGRTFDALTFGYYDGARLIYAARTRNGFTPSSREALFRKFKGPGDRRMPLRQSSRGPQRPLGSTTLAGVVDGLTAEKMKDCVWLRPVLVGRWISHAIGFSSNNRATIAESR